MGTIRIMSWNLRTLGSQPVSDYNYQRIVKLMLGQQADVICIQELQIGTGIVRGIGSPIAESSMDIIQHFCTLLNEADDAAQWFWDVSGINSDSYDSMRDAYAFIFRQYPQKSKFAHKDPVDEIDSLSSAEILRQQGIDHFPGRRPGMKTFIVTSGTNRAPFNVISYHALTPTNSFKGARCSGMGINSLATLAEIGGGITRRVVGYPLDDTGNPLPQIDTIVLGDFNFSNEKNKAPAVYQNLYVNYQPCVNDPQQPDKTEFTTYGADGTVAFRKVSAYDNIFALRAHKKFKPALVFTGNRGVYDFIKAYAEELGASGEILSFPTETAWYVVYQDSYLRQHGTVGISDHLPVWADFKVDGSGPSPESSRILSTAGWGNNCMFHAMLGTPFLGDYTCLTAPQKRIDFIIKLQDWSDTQKAFPNPAVRNGILGAMLNYFDGDNAFTLFLQRLLPTAINPFVVSFGFNQFDVNYFFGYYFKYVTNIPGRMLYVEELEAVAYINNITVTLYVVNAGRYFPNTYNAGAGNQVTMFHQGVHFSRFNAPTL